MTSDGETEFDLHNLRAFPIVPAEQLGGFRVGAHVSEYRDLLFREWEYRSDMLTDRVRQQERPWGEFKPFWSTLITLWPVEIHVDIRDGRIYRVEAKPGYEASYNGITIGTRWVEARRLEPTITWNGYEQSLTIPGLEGLYFGLSESEADGPEEYLDQLQIADIGVFDPERGTTLSLK